MKKESWETCHELHDLEVQISEHYQIQAYIARHGDISKRATEIFRLRSQSRLKLGSHLRILIESGITEEELYEYLPYISREEIKRILTNTP